METTRKYESLKERIKGKTKEEAIKWLEDHIFFIQQENYMDFKEYEASKRLLKEIENS